MQSQESFSASLNNEVMRVLLGRILLDRNFGRFIENFTNELYRAETPELGLNIAALLEFYRMLKKRDKQYTFKYSNTLFLLGLPMIGLAVLLFRIDHVFAIILSSLVIVGSWGMAAHRYYTKSYDEIYKLGELFKQGRYSSSELIKTFDFRNTQYTNNAEQNLVIFGGNSPFIGAGINIGGWSFVIDLSQSKDNALDTSQDAVPFEAKDLYKAINVMCQDLQINGLVAKDYFFVSGKDIREEKPILPQAVAFPRQKIPTKILDQYATQTDAKVRKYKWLQQFIWNSNVVISYFLFCDIRGNSLFVEADRFILLPIDEKYRQIDDLVPWNPKTKRLLIIKSILAAPVFASEDFLEGLGLDFPPITLMSDDIRRKQEEIENNPKYNYGSFASFRETISAKRFDNPFQVLDTQMFLKILERRVLNSIVDFLDQHNIDTSDIKERQTTILNSGVMVQGGNITSESIAVGTGAQAIVSSSPSTSRKE